MRCVKAKSVKLMGVKQGLDVSSSLCSQAADYPEDFCAFFPG
jgi:hypothetical protein